MNSTPLTEIVSEAARFAVGIGHGEAGLAHFVLALMDRDEATAWLRRRGVAHTDARQAMLDILDVMEPSPAPEGQAFGISVLALAALQASLEKGERAGPMTLVEAIWNLPRSSSDEWAAVASLHALAGSRAAAKAAEPQPAPVRWCTDMVAAAAEGRYDAMVGRHGILDRVIQVLTRRKKNNPVLVGEAGVGKTSIVEGLAMRIAAGEVGGPLAGCRIYALDLVAMLAGTRNRGDFEERLKELVDRMSGDRRAILFVDELHAIAGAASGAADAANLLKPALSSGALRCIGATTHAEYGRHVEADPALARRFQPVSVPEPSRDEAVEILTRIAPAYAEHHGVGYAPEAVEAAVHLSARFIVGRRLPDKAIDVLDEAGSIAAAARDRGAAGRQVGREDVRTAVERVSGVSVVQGEGLARRLAETVKGQARAVERIARAVAFGSSGLAAEGRPRCSMAFAGPPGAGKMHAARCLAEALGLPVTVLNMADYGESHSLSRLFGPPPGYVGFGNGGALTEPLRREPSCVLVLERLDLAHPDVAAAIAEAMGSGVVRDTEGRAASFAGAVVVATLCPPDSSGTAPGFVRPSLEAEAALPGPLSDCFDETVPFVPLGREALAEVAAIHVQGLVRRLASEGVGVNLEGDLSFPVADAAMAEGGGARGVEKALRRIVQEAVTAAAGGSVTIAAPAGAAR